MKTKACIDLSCFHTTDAVELIPQAPTQRPAKHQKAPQPPPLPVPEEPKPAPEPPLHQAARKGDAEEIARLLAEGHDPTVALGKTAYQVSANKAVRDAFRRHMAAEPDQWDWAAAGVPSPLSPEQEQQQQAKEVGFCLSLGLSLEAFI